MKTTKVEHGIFNSNTEREARDRFNFSDKQWDQGQKFNKRMADWFLEKNGAFQTQATLGTGRVGSELSDSVTGRDYSKLDEDVLWFMARSEAHQTYCDAVDMKTCDKSGLKLLGFLTIFPLLFFNATLAVVYLLTYFVIVYRINVSVKKYSRILKKAADDGWEHNKASYKVVPSRLLHYNGIPEGEYNDAEMVDVHLRDAIGIEMSEWEEVDSLLFNN